MALRIVRKMDELEREIGKIKTMTHDITVFLNGLELLEDYEHSQARSLIQEKIVNIEHLVKSLNELQHSLILPPRAEKIKPAPPPEPEHEHEVIQIEDMDHLHKILDEIAQTPPEPKPKPEPKPIRIVPTITRRSRR